MIILIICITLIFLNRSLKEELGAIVAEPKLERIKSASSIEVNLIQGVLIAPDEMLTKKVAKTVAEENNTKLEASMSAFTPTTTTNAVVVQMPFLNSSVHFDRPMHRSSTDSITNSQIFSDSASDDYNENPLGLYRARSFTSRSMQSNNPNPLKTLKCYNFIHVCKEPLIRIKPFCIQMMMSNQKKTENLNIQSTPLIHQISLG